VKEIHEQFFLQVETFYEVFLFTTWRILAFQIRYEAVWYCTGLEKSEPVPVPHHWQLLPASWPIVQDPHSNYQKASEFP
jgi:hypothetical protein